MVSVEVRWGTVKKKNSSVSLFLGSLIGRGPLRKEPGLLLRPKVTGSWRPRENLDFYLYLIVTEQHPSFSSTGFMSKKR